MRRLQVLGKFVAFTVDIRHHFHRIGINSEFGRFYAVRKGNEWYRPIVLPMGSRHSPSLAQTTALAIIAFRLRFNAEGIVDPEGKLESDLDLRLPEETVRTQSRTQSREPLNRTLSMTYRRLSLRTRRRPFRRAHSASANEPDRFLELARTRR